ncbi:MAG: hypothetical protein ACR2GY_06150 [Phycisphaerales bacterium]
MKLRMSHTTLPGPRIACVGFFLLVLAGCIDHTVSKHPTTTKHGVAGPQQQSVRVDDAGAEERARSQHNPIEDVPWSIASTADGAWVIAWRSLPAAIPLNETFMLEVNVESTTDVDARDVELAVDARMPHHRHGMLTQPELQRIGTSTWMVHGMQCHMPGRWELSFDISHAGITERATVVLMLD